MTESRYTIALGSDHAGFEYKDYIRQNLADFQISVKDFGTYNEDSVDYPDFAHRVATMVEEGEAALGVLFCGSGNGVAITANKHAGIRAALCWTPELAALARKHNNANIVCIPARFIDKHTATEIVNTFLNTSFEGGRHQKRVDKIAC